MYKAADLFAAATPLPTYDVVIPCFNRAHVVGDAVASVLTQSHQPTRVIVVDDGSSDGSADAIHDLERAHPKDVIAVVLPRNGGASNARNVGAALCRSDWIAFLDSDDIWLPGAAVALLAARGDADIVCGHFSRVESDGIAGPPECGWSGDEIRVALGQGGVIGPSWSISRRRCVTAIEGFDPTFHNCNDWDFYVRAAAAGAEFVRINEVVAQYRTVAGHRLVSDTVIGAVNARRVLSHPYFAIAGQMTDTRCPPYDCSETMRGRNLTP